MWRLGFWISKKYIKKIFFLSSESTSQWDIYQLFLMSYQEQESELIQTRLPAKNLDFFGKIKKKKSKSKNFLRTWGLFGCLG